MADSAPALVYYVKFDNYTQGMAMQEVFRREGVKARVAPLPRALQQELSCGMALLLMPDQIEAARACIERFSLPCRGIASLEGQINPHRHRFC